MILSLCRRLKMSEVKELCPEVKMLKEFKERHGLTVKELAKAVGVKEWIVYAWFRGIYEPGGSSKAAIRYLIMLEKTHGIRIDKNVVPNVR
jgi:DNA-binding XRE family transcriptional regulator